MIEPIIGAEVMLDHDDIHKIVRPFAKEEVVYVENFYSLGSFQCVLKLIRHLVVPVLRNTWNTCHQEGLNIVA